MNSNKLSSHILFSSTTERKAESKNVVDADKMYGYILAARKREQVRQESLRQLQSRGVETAKQAARILRQQFRATRVVLFGSMLQPKIHADSDIDLAVWNLSKSDYFQAVGKLQGLSEFAIDLIEVENASDYMIEAIAQGMEL
ncbi:nucleotidyltransferase domain-containing protein [Pseudanabaena galeata UHCC 0370]|uniref:Nucleotidyltransferase domain-containing protein n=1 Tax=Pseudanabaena galeata UHCC 0370 TaxID=3110310 RepID=A0ABU5TET5_9CYAN|nr:MULTISPECIES: nucleotidyltransferase domain-containing protein [Pseudanabaena]MEA5476769.1 nucleotidyltransferase domain-containing protein [Pseudanabaena galeata UHCC 0370]MEA5488828.1 nucleotidyltransferase domain-containing protein [Pseudanabaena sp. CCNP1317]PZV10555.1 MAG: nucleotidyltransferase domain-containing protein [Pseudanabaena sp.]WGS74933.1 nucleotidyltransferase domain-containing protein [Pseudanabaena galeata CCNP1313]